MPNESEIIKQALLSCGKDYVVDYNGPADLGLYAMLNSEPLTIICDKLAQKLNEQGYRVTELKRV